MKKICMVAYTNYLSDARPRREAEALVRRGDQVDFVSLAEVDRPSVETVLGVRIFRLRQARYRGASGLRYGLAYLKFLCAASWKVLRLFRSERYDIVYAHTMPDAIVITGLIPRFSGAKVVLNIHDMMPELYMSKFGISARHPLIRLLALQEQLSIRLAHKVICVHHPHREILRGRGCPASRITVLPNVPDPCVFRQQPAIGADNNHFRIVYHGTIAHRLGLDLAVRAFAKVAHGCPNARLEIFGDGDAGSELEQQIESSGAAGCIQFSRRMFRVESIVELIQGASVGIIPNRRDQATEYMLPVKLLEYVHLGIPVIAPRLKTIQYYFGEHQVAYYEPGDIENLAEVIQVLYSDGAKRAALAYEASEFARRFSWDSLKQRLFAVVDDWPDSSRLSPR